MTVFRNLLYAFLAVVAAFTLHFWWQTRDRSPESLIASAEARLAEGEPNLDLAIQELDQALQIARELGDLGAAQEALFQRARAYGDRRMPKLALRDARLALEEFGPRPDILEFAARTALWAGEVELTLEFAHRLEETASESEIGPDLVGRAHRIHATRELNAARAALAVAMSDEVTRNAYELARFAALLDPDTAPRRVAMERIRALVSDAATFAEVERHVEAATQALADSREAFLTSLEVRASPQAMEAFLELYLEAGQDRLAAALARAAGKRPRFQGGDGTVLLRTAQALLRVGSKGEARRLVRKGRRPTFGKLSAESLAEWCELLYVCEHWPLLSQAAARYAHAAAGQFQRLAEARFYEGLAALRRGQWEKAIAPLRHYGLEHGPELFPGARAEAWMGVAVAAQRLGRPVEEQRALEACARICPDHARDADQALEFSKAWLRLVRSQMERNLPARAEASLTRAMCFDPSRVEELTPAWLRLAQAARAERGRVLFSKEGVPLQATPDSRAGPQEILAFGEYWLAPALDEPLPSRAASYARRVLKDFPDFLPALDLLGRAYLTAGDLGRAARTLVRQIEVGGPTEEVSDRLRSIGAEAMKGDLVVRWARADPAGVLLTPFVDQLIEAGRAPLALAALRRQRRGGHHPEVAVRTAQLFARNGAWAEADLECAKLLARDEELGHHAALVVEAAWRGAPSPAEATQRLSRRLRLLARAEAIDDPDLPAAVDGLFTGGQAPAAVALLELLDRRPNAWGDELLLRQAAAAMLAGKLDAAGPPLDRAEALGDGRSAALGRMLLDGLRKDWAAVARTARRLATLDDDVDLRRAGLLAALGGDPVLGSKRLETLQRAAPGRDPLAELALHACSALRGRLAEPSPDAPAVEHLRHQLLVDLLLGYGDVRRDPRTVLLWILAARDPSWSAWLRLSLGTLPARLQRSPWVAFLAAETLLAAGEFDLALERLAPFAREVPAVVVYQERIAERRTDDPMDPTLLALRTRRVQRFGADDLDPVELGLLTVFQLERKKRWPQALRALRSLALAHPDDERVLVPLAERLRAGGELGDALDVQLHLLETGADPEERVPAYQSLLREAAAAGELSRSAHLAELEALEIQFPHDPAVARELALYSLATRGTSLGAAWERLEAFLRAHADTAIEDLRAGEAQRWLEVYLEYDPARALRFVNTQLAIRPLSLAGWSMLVEVLGRTGRFAEGLELTRDLLSVLPAPELQRWEARFLTELEEAPVAIERALDRIDPDRARKPRRKRDPELVFLEARAKLRKKKWDRRWAVKRLAELWEDRETVARTVPPLDLVTFYVGALLSPGAFYDPARAAEVLDQAEPFAEDGLHRDFLRAYRRVAELALAGEET